VKEREREREREKYYVAGLELEFSCLSLPNTGSQVKKLLLIHVYVRVRSLTTQRDLGANLPHGFGGPLWTQCLISTLNTSLSNPGATDVSVSFVSLSQVSELVNF
jgi:hypothetical protein